MQFATTFANLNDYLAGLKDQHRDIRNIQRAFGYWFAQAVLTHPENHRGIINSIVDGSNDRNCDIVFICDQTKEIYVCQMKHHAKLGVKSETHNDVTSFANVIDSFAHKERRRFRETFAGASSELMDALDAAYQAFYDRKKEYGLTGLYVTTGKVSSALRDAADALALRGSIGDRVKFAVCDGNECCRIFEAFSALVPALPQVTFRVSDVWAREDKRNKITTHVCALKAKDLKKLYEKYGERLFARNIRLDKGTASSTNRKIAHTLDTQPDHLFYLNNGLTIMATAVSARTINRTCQEITISNPQIINGQQTTRTIGRATVPATAEVLAKIVAMKPESDADLRNFVGFARDIVRATNDQNRVKQSELLANDPVQIGLYQDLLKVGWLYVRKSGTETHENTRSSQYLTGHRKPNGKITMKELCVAVVGCRVDPQLVPTRGIESIFDLDADDKYREIFTTDRDVYDYLACFLLYKAAAAQYRVVQGERSRDLAKYGRHYLARALWLAATSLQRGNGIELRDLALALGCGERTRHSLRDVAPLVGIVMTVWREYYQSRKARGESVKNFVTRKASGSDWARYWDSRANTRRRRQVESGLRRLCIVAKDKRRAV